ncbi:MAG: pyridoxamine 5'-phosphate oxidase family protein [Verrucomicrobiota bacterium]
MGRVHAEISDELRSWIQQQRIFFVSTAPIDAAGHINCSPKGGDTFRILEDCRVAYLDLTGSGVETIAHLQENGRIVVMFCAFAGPPRIVRLHGRGEPVYPSDPRHAALAARFPALPGARAVILVTVTRISDSCGMSVPRYEFLGSRDNLDRWAESKGPDGVAKYRREKNARSIDGLRGYGESGVLE